jgi:tetratricopeptide (TPR) repeat protein
MSKSLFLTPLLILVVFIICYLFVIFPFTHSMRSKLVVEKLGVLPRVEVFSFVSADHKQLVAASLVMKVMMYFGGLMDNTPGQYKIRPDYQTMSRMIHGSVKLDPYNMDAYYFAQALLVWDAHAYKVATDLMAYGMKYRTWDWYLPFFAAFNSAYFIKDYQTAAKYYKLAADLSGEPLYATLAGRYMQQTGQTEMAIAYLSAMAKTAKNEAIRQGYMTRLNALKVVRVIEVARDSYTAMNGKLPTTISEMVSRGYLTGIPSDPYGGVFYLEADGRVATTSDFTFNKLKNKQVLNPGAN